MRVDYPCFSTILRRVVQSLGSLPPSCKLVYKRSLGNFGQKSNKRVYELRSSWPIYSPRKIR
jgi:hypothetical protein